MRFSFFIIYFVLFLFFDCHYHLVFLLLFWLRNFCWYIMMGSVNFALCLFRWVYPTNSCLNIVLFYRIFILISKYFNHVILIYKSLQSFCYFCRYCIYWDFSFLFQLLCKFNYNFLLSLLMLVIIHSQFLFCPYEMTV